MRDFFLQLLAMFHWPHTGFALNFALMIVSIIVLLISGYFSSFVDEREEATGKDSSNVGAEKRTLLDANCNDAHLLLLRAF
jgi:hypothetical protein